jgi:hypothetical protein
MVNDPVPGHSTTRAASEISGEPAVYHYEPSGIRERSGYIPVWLKLISLGLIAWGIYYAIHYWNSY